MTDRLSTKAQMEAALFRCNKETWAAYTYMKYSSKQAAIKVVWGTLDQEAKEQIREIRNVQT